MASQVKFGPRAILWTVENRDIDYKEEWRQVHHYESPTPSLNGCELTLSTGTQSSGQEYSYLTASKRHPSTPYCHNTSRSFSRWTWPYTFPRWTKQV